MSSFTAVVDADGFVQGGPGPRGDLVFVDGSDDAYLVGTFSGDYQPAVGTSVPSAGGVDVYVSKYDAHWNLLWTQRFGGATDDSISARPAVNAAGDLLIGIGHAAGNGELRKLDPAGNTVWQSSSLANVVALDGAGDAFVVEPPLPSSFIGLSKLDPSGNEIYNRSFSIDGSGSTSFVRVDGDGNIILVGRLGGTIHFDGGDFRALQTENGPQAFFAKLDPGASYLAAAVAAMNEVDDVVLDGLGRTILSGVRYNPGFFRLNVFDAAGAFAADIEGSAVIPQFQVGASGALAVDRSGHVYWHVNVRTQDSHNLDFLVKVAP